MTTHAFCSITSGKTGGIIQRAQHHVCLCTPAVRKAEGDALIDASNRLGSKKVRVILDCDEEVFRLGYGDIGAVRMLREAGVDVRHCPGLRAGLLVVDDRAWAFTPTALYVQPEIHSDETPNAFELGEQAAVFLAGALCPEFTSLPEHTQENLAEPEIGQTSLDAQTVKCVTEALKVAPPLPFDITRQVRVFQPYIQYVDVSLRGFSIERQRVTIPKSIQGLGSGKEIENRLHTTFELIEKSSDLSSRALENELKQIRDNFTRALGEPWGRILIRSVRPTFDKKIKEFCTKLDEHREKVGKELGKYLAESRKQVVDYYLPLVKANPPDELLGQLFTVDLDEDDVREWLDAELEHEFPTPEQLLLGMKLDVQYRDVTYETLNEPGFADALRKAYPRVDWNKPFDEFNAAKERKET